MHTEPHILAELQAHAELGVRARPHTNDTALRMHAYAHRIHVGNQINVALGPRGIARTQARHRSYHCSYNVPSRYAETPPFLQASAAVDTCVPLAVV